MIEAGSTVVCTQCDREMRFRARQRDMQVICNVYEHGAWERVEHFHPDCYEDAAAPYGPYDERSKPPTNRA